MEAGLQWLGGRAILNSANLEDGEGEGSRFDKVMKLAKEYGAAVICLLIDEEGQARDVEWKLRVAHRIHDLAVDRYGLEPGDLIFDALTFPLSTGDNDLRRDGINTIEAIRRIKAELPGVYTTLGVSNISFGLKPAARHVLNSVFLHECVEAGLDSAIVHAARIMPLNRIPDEQREVALDLVYDRRRDGYDPLTALLDVFADVQTAEVEREDRSDWTVEQLLSQRIIDGEREGLEADLDRAMAGGLAPLAIINDVLLAGMKVVGELFATGEMQLPFVLQSAETMKTAVAYLEPHMEKDDVRRQGPHRAGDGEGRRPRHRQEPRRHHPHQQRLRGREPRHQDLHRRDDREGRRDQGRRHRDERPAGEVDADHAREPRGAERPRAWPRSPCCSAARPSPAATSSATCARCTTAGSSTARTPSRASA